MANIPVLDIGLSLDDLRVDELEPRLEFTPGYCNTEWGGDCSRQYEVIGTDPDFQQVVGSPCA
jgi:hypothetical protein